MAKIQLEEQKDLGVLPENSIVHLKVEEVEVKEVDGRNGAWQKIEFTFKILGVQATGDGSQISEYDEFLGTKIWGSVPFRLTTSAENKLRLWAEAILNMPLGVGFELDTDMFRGREVRGVTRTYDKKTTNPVTGRPAKGQGIEALLSMSGAAPVQQQNQGWSTQAPPPAGGGSWGTPPPQSQPQSQQVQDPWGPTDEPPF